MSYPLVILLMIAMTLTPGASYCEALATLAGLPEVLASSGVGRFLPGISRR